MQLTANKTGLRLTPILVALGLALLLVLVLSATQQNGQAQELQRGIERTSLVRPFANERPPRDDQVAAQAAGFSLDGTDNADALNAWYEDFYSKKEKSGPNPRAYEERMAELEIAEAQGVSPNALNMGEIGEAKMLMIPFEFNSEDMLATCEADNSTPAADPVSVVEGPLHGTIPNPADDGDNNTIWTDDFSIEWYENLMFGDGVGVVRTDLNDGAGVDLSGVSARIWYEEQSEGLYTIDGDIYENWIQLDHSVAYYGWDNDELNPEGTGYPCEGATAPYTFVMVSDVVDKINAMDPDFDWAQYDVDGDGIVDHLMLIHAGIDNSAGGGSYGNYQLWAHSWDVYTLDGSGTPIAYGYLADDRGTADPDDDIYVANYTHIPEDADIGVVVHEYGHDIGLPDYYDTSGVTSNSTAHWLNMASGSWSGALGGSHPAPFNPWGRYFFGWSDPKMVSYDDPAQSFMIGQSEPTPEGTEDTVWIGLPDQAISVENMAGDGKGLHTILGNQVVHSLYREFDLSGAADPVMTFDTYFQIEEDWDYVYVRASTDDGATWDILLNDEGEYATSDPNGSFAWLGEGGLTNFYEGTLTYDLSAYAGDSSVWISFDYVTDQAFQDPGMWLDNISIDDDEDNIYANDMEDTSDWTNTDGDGGPGWEVVPYDEYYSHYYMLEWRNNAGSIASKGHNYQYYSLAHDESGWLVDKFPANAPGMLVWYRNNRYSDNNALGAGRGGDGPAYGPKGELLLVDANYDTIEWSNGYWDPTDVDADHPLGQPAQSFSNRRAAMDGAFSMYDSPPWMLHDYADSANEVMDFGSKPAVPHFHDSMRSVPGWIYPNGGSTVYAAAPDSSVVIPGAPYSTRIRGLAEDGMHIGDDIPGFWGIGIQNSPLGPGNPGDSWAQWGVHLAVTEQASDGTYGVINFHNSFFETEAMADFGAYGSGDHQFITPGGSATANVMVQNVGAYMEDALVVVELPANISYVPGSMPEGSVGVSRDDVANIQEAADYIRTMGFAALEAADEPENVGYVAVHMDEFFNSTYAQVSYDYMGMTMGTESSEYLIDHLDSGTFGTVRPLPDFAVQYLMAFTPVVAGTP